MNVIEIKNLTKLYGNGRGIKNLNLTVEQGDILGLLGPNGSGKTTAMKAILNLVNAEGSVKVFGMDLHDNFESIMQRTGALIESPAIYKDLSAYQNVKMHANMYPPIFRISPALYNIPSDSVVLPESTCASIPITTLFISSLPLQYILF